MWRGELTVKRFLVIECGNENYFLHVHEVEQSYDHEDKGVVYRRRPDQSAILLGEVGDPKFFGKLNALLFTANSIEQAAPITPESETSHVE
jgi:hypothetical protein